MDNYKQVLSDKKKQAERIMNKEQLTKCNVAIHTASVASAAAGAIPIPVADAIPITTAQITMVMALGKIFDANVTESIAKSIVSAAASTFVGRSLVKMIPIFGWGISATVAAGVTEAIGWTVAVDFAQKAKDKWEKEHNSNMNQFTDHYNGNSRTNTQYSETDHCEAENAASSDETNENCDQKSVVDALVERARLFVSGTKKRCDNEEEYTNLLLEIEKLLDSLENDHILRELYDSLCLIIE